MLKEFAEIKNPSDLPPGVNLCDVWLDQRETEDQIRCPIGLLLDALRSTATRDGRNEIFETIAQLPTILDPLSYTENINNATLGIGSLDPDLQTEPFGASSFGKIAQNFQIAAYSACRYDTRDLTNADIRWWLIKELHAYHLGTLIENRKSRDNIPKFAPQFETEAQSVSRLALSSRAKAAIKDGKLHISKKDYDQARAEDNFKIAGKLATAIGAISPILIGIFNLPAWGAKRAIRVTDNGTSGSFGSIDQSALYALCHEKEGDAYYDTYHLNDPVTFPNGALSDGTLIINRTDVTSQDSKRELPLLAMLIRGIEELCQSSVAVVTHKNLLNFGFAVDELVAETVLSELTLNDIDLLKDHTELRNQLLTDAEILGATPATPLNRVLSEDSQTIAPNANTVEEKMGQLLKHLVPQGRVYDLLFSPSVGIFTYQMVNDYIGPEFVLRFLQRLEDHKFRYAHSLM